MDREMKLMMIVCLAASGVFAVLFVIAVSEVWPYVAIPAFIGMTGFAVAAVVAFKMGRRIQYYMEPQETAAEFAKRTDWTWKTTLLLIERGVLSRQDAESIAAKLWEQHHGDDPPEAAVDRWFEFGGGT